MAAKKATESRVIPIGRESRKYHQETYYQKCKGYRHAMEPVNIEVGGGEQIVTVRCVRCGTTRYDFFDMQWRKTRISKYKWPKGYRNPGQGRMNMADWRAKYLRDVIATSRP